MTNNEEFQSIDEINNEFVNSEIDKKDEENFVLPEEVKTNLWKEILNLLKKNKRERGTKK